MDKDELRNRLTNLIQEEFDLERAPQTQLPLGSFVEINSINNLVLLIIIEAEIGVLLNSKDIDNESTVDGLTELIISRNPS
jgi:acyl carrier protein